MVSVRVPLTNDAATYAHVSIQDAERVLAKRWRLVRGKYTNYASTGRRETEIQLHRFVIGTPPGMETHHIDHRGLNCVRSNLSVVTHKVNGRSQIRKRGKSGYIGVVRRRIKFQAYINTDDGWTHLGVFDTAEEAARAYDDAARRRDGDAAIVNFPREEM